MDNNVSNRLLLADTVMNSMGDAERADFVKVTMYSHFGKISKSAFQQCWEDYGMDKLIERYEEGDVTPYKDTSSLG
jgi:hypothetical protein